MSVSDLGLGNGFLGHNQGREKTTRRTVENTLNTYLTGVSYPECIQTTDNFMTTKLSPG